MTVFVLDESTVPDVSYYNAKEQTRVLYEKSDKDININDLSYLNNYYRQLYTVSGFDKDIEKLTNALSDENCLNCEVAYPFILFYLQT